jgi:sugar lactone lactonase YvrE
VVSVAELMSDGRIRPFPSESWNGTDWRKNPKNRFVAVQSVYLDPSNRLWILDSGNPQFSGVVEGAPKLLSVELGSERVARVYRFPKGTVLPESYLNDVRVDPVRNVAYISDSGAGALLVVDLKSGSVRRLLSDHPSTQAEETDVIVEGVPWRVNGEQRKVHVDGIALNPKGTMLYFQALTGRTLYRVPAEALRDRKLSSKQLAKKVEAFLPTFPADGMIFGGDGKLYLSSLEDSSVKRVSADKSIETVAKDPRLSWPDSFGISSRGTIVVTTTRIHEGDSPTGPYQILELKGIGMAPPAEKVESAADQVSAAPGKRTKKRRG